MTDALKNLFARGAKQTISITTDILVDGNPLVITDADIMLGTFSIDRTIMEGSSLSLGACVAAELNMTLNNMDGRFNGISWNGAQLTVEVGIDGVAETVPMGVFYIDRVPKTRNTIAISALDGMTKLDKYFVDDPDDPTIFLDEWTLGDVINFACTDCGITLATDISSFPNATYEFTLFAWPTLPNITYRQWVSAAVALMGKVAWMNGDGELEIGFADALTSWTNTSIVGMAIVGLAIVGDTSGSGDVTDTFGRDKRFSSDYEDTNIEITGLSYTDSATDVIYLAGTEDYTFDLSGNIILIRTTSFEAGIHGGGSVKTVSDILNNLTGLIGFEYTPISMETVPCPHIYPTDWVAYVIDDDHYVYALVTSYTFTLNGRNYISAQGELPQDRQLAPINAVATLQTTVDSMMDYVIDQGTSGGWRYRKWKNGYYECWYRASTNVSITTAWGGIYYGEIPAVSFPITFKSEPVMVHTVDVAQGGAWGVSARCSTTSAGIMYLFRPTSSSSVAAVHNIYAYGRWK